MQFSDSTLVALDLPSNEPSRFGRTLVMALVLTAAAICAALLVEVEMFGDVSDPPASRPAATTRTGGAL